MGKLPLLLFSPHWVMSLSSCHWSLWVPASTCLGKSSCFPCFREVSECSKINRRPSVGWLWQCDSDTSGTWEWSFGNHHLEFEFKILDQRNSQVAISGKQALASEFISTHNWFFPPFISKLYVLWSSSSLMFMQRWSPYHSLRSLIKFNKAPSKFNEAQTKFIEALTKISWFDRNFAIIWCQIS